MCGIAGWFNRSDVTDPHALLGHMLHSMVHRGPDDEGRRIDGDCAIGMRRLSIIDVAGGHQPIANEDCTVWVVLNGEIYNYKQLRHELEELGHVFKTRSDTEVIVHGYEEWGDDVVTRLNGIFGIGVWDQLRRRLLLARDHFGVKPLYFRSDGRALTFASEIKALLSDPQCSREVDLEALDLFLTFRFVPSPFTMFKGIRKLAPGHRLIVDQLGTKIERFYKETPSRQLRLNETEWIELLQDKLEAAVRRQMMSDVPLGALLSGGIDSGAIVAIMAKATSLPVQTFTVGFDGAGSDINELDEARRTAAILGTEHHEIKLSSLDYEELLHDSIWHLDEPVATTSALAMYCVCKLARKHVTVVLTGQGVDEPMAGYYRHFGERYGAHYRRVPSMMRDHMIRPIVELLPRREGMKRAARSLGTSDAATRFSKVYAVFSQQMKDRLWQQGLCPADSSEAACSIIQYWLRGTEHLSPLEQMSYVDARLSLSDDLLLYGDKMSMAASIEARVPFLDLEYMRVVEDVPPELRIKGVTQKYLHKQVVKKWLPAEITNRPKRGFETPVDQWFRSELSGYVRRMLTSAESASPKFFSKAAIDSLLAEHLSGRQDNNRQLYSLLVFEIWHRQFIEQSAGQSNKREVMYAD